MKTSVRLLFLTNPDGSSIVIDANEFAFAVGKLLAPEELNALRETDPDIPEKLTVVTLKNGHSIVIREDMNAFTQLLQTALK